jgi:hypothetical protein
MLCGGFSDIGTPDADYPVLPGADSAVGLGVDIRRGYNTLQKSFPTTNALVSRKVTPGYSPGHPPVTLNGQSYNYPDTMDCQVVTAESVSFSTSSYSNSQSMVNDIFLKAKIDVDASALKLDLGLQVTNDKSSMDKSSHTHSSSAANVETVHCSITEFPALDVNFTNHVLMLSRSDEPTPYEWQEYDNFLETWGTHYIDNAMMGGSATSSSTVDSSYTFTQSDRDVQVNVAISFEIYQMKLAVHTNNSETHKMQQFLSMSDFQALGGDSDLFIAWVNAGENANSTARGDALAAYLDSVVQSPNKVPGQTHLRNITDLLNIENFQTQSITESELQFVRENIMDRLGIDEAFKIPQLWACKFQGEVLHEDEHGFRYYNFSASDCEPNELPLGTHGSPGDEGLVKSHCVYGFATRADHCGFGSNLLWEVEGTHIRWRFQGYECSDKVEFEVHYLCVEGAPPVDLHQCSTEEFGVWTSGFQQISWNAADCNNHVPGGVCYATIPKLAYESSTKAPQPTAASLHKICPTGVANFMLLVENSTSPRDKPTALCLSLGHVGILPHSNPPTTVLTQLEPCNASDPGMLFLLINVSDPTSSDVQLKHLTSGKCLAVGLGGALSRVAVVDCESSSMNTNWMVETSSPGSKSQVVSFNTRGVFTPGAMSYCANATACMGVGDKSCLAVAAGQTPGYQQLQFTVLCGAVTNWGLWGLTARPPPAYHAEDADGRPLPPWPRNTPDNMPAITFRGPATGSTIEVGAHYFCTEKMVGNASFPKLHQCTVASLGMVEESDGTTSDLRDVGKFGQITGSTRRWRTVTLTDAHCTNGLPPACKSSSPGCYVATSLRRTEENGIMPINFKIQGHEVQWEDNFYQENTVLAIDFMVYDPQI